MKILTVVGARPQFIKAAPVSLALRDSGHTEFLVHTGQHYDHGMSQVFFDELGIPEPDVNLGVGSGSHGLQTGRMLIALEKVIDEQKPDCVLVYGDTNSTLAGALAAAKLHVPVAHVEAGLRSFNREMPEEHNRVLTDHCADLLFAPTITAVHNLRREGIPEERIQLVGDVMYDAAIYYGKKAERESRILERLELSHKDYILATVHRAENTDDPVRLKAIIEGLAQSATKMHVVFPAHPRTRKALELNGLWDIVAERLRVLDPVGYLDMVMLEKKARLIATDSGGVQKEAFFHKVPCVTLREETEWVELVEAGANRLVKAEAGNIVAVVEATLESVHDFHALPYGRGDAGNRIVEALLLI